jgi:anaerobic selenocysteine-containing dehydrogenase
VAIASGGIDEQNSFVLIGRRQLRSNNSWMHNCPSLMTGVDRCSLLMNPADGARLGVDGSRWVRVSSAVGDVDIAVELTDDMMPGVVSMPHGFGHSRPGVRMSLAQAKPGASMNDITDDGPTEGLMGNGILTAVPVRIAVAESP